MKRGDFTTVWSKENKRHDVYRVGLNGVLKPTDLYLEKDVFAEITEVKDPSIPKAMGIRWHWWRCNAQIDPGFSASVRIQLENPLKSSALLGRRVQGKLDVTQNQLIIAFVKFVDQPAEGEPPETENVKTLDQVIEQIRRVQAPVVEELQALLRSYEGRTFPIEGKEEISTRLQSIFRSLGLGVICPKTGQLGKLRLKRAGRDNRLVFEIQIWEKGRRTSHFSSSTFPRLELDYLPSDFDE